MPETRRDDSVVETLHGIAVPDPYRWLEDPDAPETVAWVAAQNEVTEAYLAGLPDRDWFAATMNAVVRRPRAGVPYARGGRYVVTRNDGSQDQDVWFVADSLAELRAGGRVLVDPNTLSADGTRALTSFSVSTDGARAAYGLSDAGSDWLTFALLDLADGTAIEDPPVRTKFSEAAWLPDGQAYAYTAFAATVGADGTETDALPGPELRVHRVGTPVEADEVVLSFAEDPQTFAAAEVTDDDRFLAVSIFRGTDPRNRLWLYPIETVAGRSALGPAIVVVDEPHAEVTPVTVDGRQLVVQTDLDAERGRLVRVDLDRLAATGAPDWVELVAEREDTLLTVVAVRDGFVAAYLADARPTVRRFDRTGDDLGVVPVDGGALVALHGDAGTTECFLGLSSVTEPTRAYRLDTATGTVEPLADLVPVAPGTDFVPPSVRSSRRAATSRDRTRIPYFLLVPDDDDLDQPRPTLLYGYGGFRIPVLADYRAGWSGWLAAGGRLAIANLRGGGEFGAAWHEAGRLARKQNVFDDAIAVAEDLVATGVTSSDQLALHGRSNGGLLVGAVLTQRPDLFAVALPGVGVMDMLRFARFTVGAAWIAEVGDPDDPADFAVLRAYSPLHRLADGTAYPATLVLTGDHDDRVVPLHSHKFTATLQHAQAGAAPVLTRVETTGGHGVGKPLSLEAAEWADLLAFAAHHTGLAPNPVPA